jgi:hypothetical protein
MSISKEISDDEAKSISQEPLSPPVEDIPPSSQQDVEP